MRDYLRSFNLLWVGAWWICICEGAEGAELNWPQFRGPNGQGIVQSAKLPVQWSDSSGVAWKTPIPGRGWSSPIVLDGKVWVTTATEDGKELSVLRLDAKSGKIEFDQKLFDVEKPQFAHKFNTYASPSPVAERGRVYVTFGSPGTACLDARSGKKLWERRDIECNHFRGAGSSPIIFQNLLIMNYDGSDYQFVLALDKRTGKTVWKTNRSIDFKDLTPDGKPEADGDWRKAYATPHVASIQRKPMLISQGAKAMYAYEPLNGSELWRVEERTSHSGGTRPIVFQDHILFPTGWSQGQILSVNAAGRGDVTSSNVRWSNKRSVPKKPSLVLVNQLLFMVDDSGIAACLDPQSGTEVWRERIGGNYSASPIATKDRVYFFSEEGKTTVVEASRTFRVLSTNQLGDGFMASPAVSGDALILRSKTALFRINP